MPADFGARAEQIRDRIAEAATRAGRSAEAIELVAVAKTATPDSLKEAAACGQQVFAHNRVQPLVEHHAVLPEADWHLIGPLQRNKARKAIERVSCIETVADLKLAQNLARICSELGKARLGVFIQVNLSPEDGRAGVPIGNQQEDRELAALCEQLHGLPELELRGLMTLAPAEASASELHRHFARARNLAEALAQKGLLPASPQLSMGMSGDFEIAVEEGATLVRVGRALFPPA